MQVDFISFRTYKLHSPESTAAFVFCSRAKSKKRQARRKKEALSGEEPEDRLPVLNGEPDKSHLFPMQQVFQLTIKNKASSGNNHFTSSSSPSGPLFSHSFHPTHLHYCPDLCSSGTEVREESVFLVINARLAYRCFFWPCSLWPCSLWPCSLWSCFL